MTNDNIHIDNPTQYPISDVIYIQYPLFIKFSNFNIYFITMPGNKISPNPNNEHFIKGELYDLKREGHTNFIGKSI